MLLLGEGRRPRNWEKGDQEEEKRAFPQSQERPARAGGEGLGPRQARRSLPAGRRERGPRRPTWVDEGLPAAPAGRERTGTGLAHGCAPAPRRAAGDPLRPLPPPPPPPPPAPRSRIPGSGADVTEAGAGRGAETALFPARRRRPTTGGPRVGDGSPGGGRWEQGSDPRLRSPRPGKAPPSGRDQGRPPGCLN